MKLSEVKTGETCIVTAVGGEGSLRNHFLDMGVIPGVRMTMVKLAPMGDPMEFRIHGYELTLRVADAAEIDVMPTDEEEDDSSLREVRTKKEHPGLGEEGRYHSSENAHPLPDDHVLRFALAGNQNSGKTTLFNQLTGSSQHVGNFPGVTVEGKSGVIRGYPKTEVMDLPGIYSLSPYTDEEIVSREYIIREKPEGIIDIADATNLERNLYLTLQLMELHVPMVLALNMMDELKGNGGSIDINRMEEMLGIPVIPISAAKNEGVDELIRHAVHVAHYREFTGRDDFCGEDDHGGAVHRCLHGIMYLIQDHARKAGIPERFAATKAVEGDERILEALALEDNEKEMLEHIIVQMEQERGLDRSAAIADMRFSFIEKVTKECLRRPKESRERERSEKIDRVLTGRYTAIPAFIAIMACVFWITFHLVGLPLQDLLAEGVGRLAEITVGALERAKVSEVILSLISDCLFEGVGTVLSFIPIIIILFFFLSILEDSGYMARVAFVMDKLLRKIGLSGRSIVPMLVGFGCSVPGVMSSRTLPSQRDRSLTVMLIPFMSCTAKLPIYAFFTASFFPQQAAAVMVGLYLFGILMAVLTALIMKKTVFRGEAVPFVMELPNYRMPRPKNVLQLLWEKSEDFFRRAFTVILMATLVIWVLKTFDFSFNLLAEEEMQNSILAAAGSLIAPLLKPLGFGDWRMATALITGFIAKESVVSTLQVLYRAAPIVSVMSSSAALGFLVFCLLYTPCVAAVSAIRRELGTKSALRIVAFQCVVAWIAAFAVHLIVMAFAL